MFLIKESAENVVFGHMRSAGNRSERRALRTPFIFLSSDDKIALVPNRTNSLGGFGLPNAEITRWPTPNIRTLEDMAKMAAKDIFLSGRKTPIDPRSTRNFKLAEIMRTDAATLTLVLPMAARLLAESDNPCLVSAISSTGKTIGTQWFDMEAAIEAVAVNEGGALGLNDSFVTTILARSLTHARTSQ